MNQESLHFIREKYKKVIFLKFLKLICLAAVNQKAVRTFLLLSVRPPNTPSKFLGSRLCLLAAV